MCASFLYRLADGLKILAFLCIFVAVPGWGTQPEHRLNQSLEGLDIHFTQGAAPDYVNDDACGHCHAQYQSYQDVAMAKSFYRPSPDNVIEDLQNNHYYHPPSRRHYELTLRDGEYWFKRYQLDEQGRPLNVFERKVDWILGSGNHVRTYLYQSALGELFQLPLAWYSQDRKWGMQPGYDKADHQGILRPVRRECMFCHNAYPDVPTGSDTHLKMHLFPTELPEGIGCQRCHGPGGEHVRRVLGGETDRQRIRDSIVNPGRLTSQRRDEVCFECHMLPAVAATPVRRFDRPDYSFRPGAALSEYQVSFNIREPGQTLADRFEINHHPYRLLQSQCYSQSEGRLSCLSCHDPHVKIKPQRRAAHYRHKCLTCHEGVSHAQSEYDVGDCARCHMPRRRTHDVIQVYMTDHLIRVVSEEDELLVPRKERTPVIEDILLLQPQEAPQGDLGEIYRLIGIVRTAGGASPEALDYLEVLLSRSPPDSAVPYHDLARGLLHRKETHRVLAVLDTLSERHGDTGLSLAWRGLSLIMLNRLEEAREVLLQALAKEPLRPETHYNLGLALVGLERWDDAYTALHKAVELRPNLHLAWYYLGMVAEQRGHHREAAEHFRRVLQIDPGHTRSYLSIARALRSAGATSEALRYLRHGAEYAKRPQTVRQKLTETTTASEAAAR